METRGVYGVQTVAIRPECLIPLPGPWVPPTGAEISAAISMAGLKGASFGRAIDVSGRNVRRWMNDEAVIPYAAWAWLAARAGLAELWRPGMAVRSPDGGAYSFELDQIEGAPGGWRVRLFERGQERASKEFMPEEGRGDVAYHRALAEGTAWLDSEAETK